MSNDINTIKKIYKYIYIIIKSVKIINVKLIVRFVNKSNIKNLNFEFRKKNINTNIISFPYIENTYNKDIHYIGDIVVCSSIIKKQSKKRKEKPLDYWKKIILHGVLHLLGFDHKSYFDFKKMEKIEKKVFLKLKITKY